jgi:hypothetical protein
MQTRIYPRNLSDRLSPFGGPISRRMTPTGYWVLVWRNPVTHQRTVLQEHRVVWSEHFGEIPKSHVIHHKNGDHGDNRITNLQCMTRSEHFSLHRTTPEGKKTLGAKAYRHNYYWRDPEESRRKAREARAKWYADPVRHAAFLAHRRDFLHRKHAQQEQLDMA